MDITMLFKNLHTLCPLHLNAITQDLLFSNFVFFLLDPCPVDWAIGTCPGTYTFSHCRLLFLPRKVDDQMCCTLMCCTMTSSAHWEDFCLYCLLSPTLNVAVMQLLFTFSLYSHTRPTHPKTWLVPPSSSDCIRFLYRWPRMWAEGVSLMCNHGGDMGVCATCFCGLLMSSGPTWLQSQTFYFHLTVDCC